MTTAILKLHDRDINYALKHEDKGWIFRCENESNHGLNGHHETDKKAIHSAKRLGCIINQ